MLKRRRAQALGYARALNHRAERRRADTQEQRYSDHTFISDQPHFKAGMVVEPGPQRNEAATRKEDVAYGFARLMQNIGRIQFDLLAVLQQTVAIIVRQTGEQPIFAGNALRGRHRGFSAGCVKPNRRRKTVLLLSHFRVVTSSIDSASKSTREAGRTGGYLSDNAMCQKFCAPSVRYRTQGRGDCKAMY